MTPDYGSYDGLPIRFNDDEAWVLGRKDKQWTTWRQVNLAEHGMTTQPMTQADFEEAFGELPPLPSAAFHSGG